MIKYAACCFGEFFGTFLLVFFGTSIVAVSVLFNAPSGLVQVAMVWGLGVTLAIYATRHLSCAHLNPAVSLGMVLAGRMRPQLLFPYWACQLLGGVAAGGCVLLIFHTPIAGYEAARRPSGTCFHRRARGGIDRRSRPPDPGRDQPGTGFRPTARRISFRLGTTRHTWAPGRLFLGLYCSAFGWWRYSRFCLSLFNCTTDDWKRIGKCLQL